MGVGEDLDLDMAAMLDVLLDQDRVVAERAPCLALRGSYRRVVLPSGPDDPHALAPPPAAALTRTGKAISVVEPVRDHSVARDHRHPGGDRDLAGGVLPAHLVHHHRTRADQLDARGFDGSRERRALGEEAVAGVDGVRTGLLRGGDDGLDVEVRRDGYGEVGGPDVGCGAVQVGVDRHRPQSELAGRAQHPECDLAPVRNQESVFIEIKSLVSTEARPAGATCGRCRSWVRVSARWPRRPGPCRGRDGCRRGRSRRRPRAARWSSTASPGARTGLGSGP